MRVTVRRLQTLDACDCVCHADVPFIWLCVQCRCCMHLILCTAQMLDADDAILEQAMQTGAALKRARDNQKAARKPKVTITVNHLWQ